MPSGNLFVDWGQYGKYELTCDPATKTMTGSVAGDPAQWRKMEMKRLFTPAETALLDSVWELEHPGGKFMVEFRGDGQNHFICNDFPAHSHWLVLNGDSPTPTIGINWGKYGLYELVIAADGQTMAGSAKGDPDNWRRARRTGRTCCATGVCNTGNCRHPWQLLPTTAQDVKQ